jgi:hypothetical protein
MRKVLETEHFEVWRETGLPDACAALGEWLEGYYSVFSSYLEVQRTTKRKITYKQFDHIDAAYAACGGAASNCYLGGSDTIVALVPLYPHEIAHVFETLVGGPGDAPAFFSEAMASALGGGFGTDRDDRRVDASIPIEDLLDDAAFWKYVSDNGPDVIYSTAAGFVRYLIETHGKETFLAFYAALDGVKGKAKIEQVYSTATGAALADTIASWRAGPQPIVDDLLLVSAGCQISPLLAPGQTMDVDPQCIQGGFLFDVDASGRADVVLQSERAYVKLRSCELGDLTPGPGFLLAPLFAEVRVAVNAPPGRYEGIVTDDAATIQIPTDPITVDVDAACSQTRVPAPIGGPRGSAIAVVRRWTATVEQSVSFDVEAQSAGALGIFSSGSNDVLSPDSTAPQLFYLCPDPCPAAPTQSCAMDDIRGIGLMTDPTLDVFRAPLTEGQLLHFQTGPRSVQDWAYSVRLQMAAPQAQP